eukprot:820920-Ditylum_brightwellii.AAC.1
MKTRRGNHTPGSYQNQADKKQAQYIQSEMGTEPQDASCKGVLVQVRTSPTRPRHLTMSPDPRLAQTRSSSLIT